MADAAHAGVPLQFSASFPCDARFAPAVADLGVHVALALGYPEDEARAIARAIDEAFQRAAGNGAGQGDVRIDVTLRAAGDALDARVCCARRTLLDLTRPRPH